MNLLTTRHGFNPLTSRWRQPFMAGVALTLFVIFASCFDLLVEHQREDSRQQLQQRVALSAAQKKARLEGELASVRSLVDGIVAYITKSPSNRHELEGANIDLLLSVLYRHAPHVRSIAIAPGNRISYVYPLAGNEKAVNVYYPDLADQWPMVSRVIQEKRPLLAGPINLVQGGHGLAYRAPVYVGKDSTYWGLLSAVINSDALFRDAGLHGHGPVEYALRGKDGLGAAGAVFLGDAQQFEKPQVLISINTSAGEWLLAARPRGGWQQGEKNYDTVRLIGLALAALIAALVYYLLQLAAARRQSQHGLRLAQFTIDKAAEAILWIDASGHVIYQNEAAGALLPGRALQLGDVVPGLSPQHWQQRWQALKQQGSATQESEAMASADSLYLETTFNYLIYGRQELAVSFSRDITARKQAEAAMRASQQQTSDALHRAARLAHIVNSTTSAVLLTDRDGRVRWCNQAFCSMTGRTLEEVLGQKPGAFLQGPRTQPDRVQLMRERLARQQGFRVEIINYRKDGLPFWIDLEVQPMHNERGEVDGYMSVQSDISSLKRSEQRLEEAQRIAQMGFWEYDIEQKTALWSSETYRIYDLPAGKTVDMATMHTVIHPDDLPAFQECLRRALRSDAALHNECRIVRSSGEVRHVRHIGGRVPPDQTRRAKLFGTVQDITDQKRAEGLKNEFVSVVSHELRTPLTSMRGALGLLDLMLQQQLAPEGRRLLDLAHRNCERLLLLINDLLDMEKISYGKMEIKLQQQALQPLLLQAVAANQPYGDRYGVRFVLHDEATTVQVRIDSHRLHQVLANLLSNAAKFSGQEGASDSMPVDIRVQLSDRLVRVSVQDYGAGIAPALHHRMFQTFSQADSSDARSRGGTGLGLAISKALIERMGGHIGFDSAAGQGTTFWFELPIADQNPVTA